MKVEGAVDLFLESSSGLGFGLVCPMLQMPREGLLLPKCSYF